MQHCYLFHFPQAKIIQMHISEQERDAVYKTIFSRRDVRSDFINKSIPEDVLKRVLTAAHHAPSVGFMQPWDFIVINDKETKQKIKHGFEQANSVSKKMFADNKQQSYQKLKLEGILEAPIGICVTCDRERNGPVVLGNRS
jgi:5,6-dimethylbenzimidazole synthase